MPRSSLITAVVLVATLFAVGCAQTSSPVSPSSFSSVSGSTSSVQSTSTFAPPLAPYSLVGNNTSRLLADLNVVDRLLVMANRQLNLCVDPPPAKTPPEWYFYLDFEAAKVSYEEATSRLDGVAPNYAPLGLGTDALNRIIDQANITLVVNLPPQCPAIPVVKAQAQHIVSVATALINCQKAPCS